MKKIILFLSLLMGLNSCITEDFEKPNKTEYIYRVYQGVKYELLQQLEMFDNAYRINQWIKAPTLREKQEIEDLYFTSWKIRQRNDTILLFNNNDYGERKQIILTFNQAFDQPGSQWTAIGKDSIQIVNLSGDLWKIYTGNDRFNFQIQFQDKVNKETNYKVTGSGVFKFFQRQVYMSIEKRLIYSRINYENLSQLSLGEITLNMDKQAAEFPAKVVIKPQSYLEISYRGITERWN